MVSDLELLNLVRSMQAIWEFDSFELQLVKHALAALKGFRCAPSLIARNYTQG
jgi:hypothetical protein